MPSVEELLQPIPGDNPCGENLYYSPVFDKIKEARRQEEQGPMGLWEHERKVADFKLVIKLAEDLLLNKTKDLQLAVWLIEAWINRDRVAGLNNGLLLIQGFLEKYWDNLYPAIEDDDLELRATPLEWLGGYFDPSKGNSPILLLRAAPLTQGGFGWFDYRDSRAMGSEQEVQGNDSRSKARAEAIKAGKTTPEAFDESFTATPKPFYRKLEADCKAAKETLAALDDLCKDKFRDFAPSYVSLRTGIEEVSNTVKILLTRKLETDPDPIEATPLDGGGEGDGADGVGEPGVERTGSAPTTNFSVAELENFSGGQIGNSGEAILHVLAAAQFLRRQAPASPVPYLVLRGLRWGELRAAGETIGGLLDAPASDIRRGVKQYAGQKDWKRVLETAEVAMSSTCGRGWLDLQRYSIVACEELGYKAAAQAMRSELKSLLTDFPTLPVQTLTDDTGTANPDTLAWLREQGFIS